MANTGRKTRVSACIDGVERELFSVQQRSDRSLTFMSGTPSLWENMDGGFTEFDKQHYSVHKTKNGRDTSITQKTWLRDGTHHSNVAYIHNTSEHLLWPIHARRVPILKDRTRLLTPRAKDSVIELAQFEVETASLLYSVFVAKTSFDIDPILAAGVRLRVARFDEFQVLALPVYLNLPSLDSGDVFGLATSPTVVNEIRSDNHYQLHTESLPATQILPLHWAMMDLLRTKMLDRIKSFLGAESQEVIFAHEIASRYTSEPLVRARPAA